MTFSQLSLPLLLAGLPLVGLAQSNSAAPAPRYYVGLGVYSGGYLTHISTHYGDGTTVPVQATVGYQLRPRLAVQLGVAYSAYSGAYEGTATDFSTSVAYPYRSSYRNWFVTVSALGRYTLTRQPSHRFQFDLLGGLVLEHYAYHGTGYYWGHPSASQPVLLTTYDNRSSNSVYFVALGAGVRYQLSSRFALTYDGLLNVDVQGGHPPFSHALGLRYSFGRR